MMERVIATPDRGSSPPSGGPEGREDEAASPAPMRRGWARAAIRGVVRPAPLPVWIAAGLLFLVGTAWAVVTPATRAPDEVHHLNSVLRIADGEGWPRPGDGRLFPGIRDLRDLSGATDEGLRTSIPGSINPAPDAVPWTSLPPTPAADRPTLAALQAVPGTSPGVDHMTQHPPGYYAFAAAVVRLADAQDWRYDHALLLLRVLTGLTIALSVPICVYTATRDLTGRESVARSAAFLPLLIPQLGFIGGAVTNDGVTIATAAVLTAVLVRVMSAGPSLGRLTAAAVAAGLVCWTKGTALTILPLIPLALAVAHLRFTSGTTARRLLLALRDSVLALGLAFVLGGWWWALNLLRYGRLQPAGFEVPVNEGRPVLSFGEFLGQFGSRISQSFFGYVGLMEAPLALVLTSSLTWGFLALAVLGLMSRRRIAERAALLSTILLSVGALFASVYSAHLETHNYPGLQGRYLFVLLTPVLVLVAAGGARLARLVRLPAGSAVLLVAVLGVAVATAGLLSGFTLFYLPEAESIGFAVDLFLGRAPVRWPTMVVLGVAVMALLLLLAYAEGRAARRIGAGRPVAPSRSAVAAAPAEPPEDVSGPFPPAVVDGSPERVPTSAVPPVTRC